MEESIKTPIPKDPVAGIYVRPIGVASIYAMALYLLWKENPEQTPLSLFCDNANLNIISEEFTGESVKTAYAYMATRYPEFTREQILELYLAISLKALPNTSDTNGVNTFIDAVGIPVPNQGNVFKFIPRKIWTYESDYGKVKKLFDPTLSDNLLKSFYARITGVRITDLESRKRVSETQEPFSHYGSPPPLLFEQILPLLPEPKKSRSAIPYETPEPETLVSGPQSLWNLSDEASKRSPIEEYQRVSIANLLN